MVNYKIVASDLDGTLLNSNGELSNENSDAISALVERGVAFVPATGRSFAEIPKVIKDNPKIRYFIHSSGAVVYDKLTGKRISFCFPAALSSKIFDILFKTDCHLTTRYLGAMYTSLALMNEKEFSRHKVWKPHADLLKSVGIAIEDFEEKFKFTEGVEMISVFIGDNERLCALKNLLADIPEVNVASACDFNIELTYAKAGKGNALLALADSLHISPDQTIAVGDSENDIPMICSAGLGLAVSNATDELRSASDKTICSNDQHAMLYILNNYF